MFLEVLGRAQHSSASPMHVPKQLRVQSRGTRFKGRCARMDKSLSAVYLAALHAKLSSLTSQHRQKYIFHPLGKLGVCRAGGKS